MEGEDGSGGDEVGFLAGGGNDVVDKSWERGGGVAGDDYEAHVFGGVAVVKGEELGVNARFAGSFRGERLFHD